MNRAERRQKPQKKPETLREWIQKSDLVVRRGEMWEVIMKAIQIERLDRKRNNPWWRLMRFLSRGGTRGD